ncbi:ParA family protein [Clostridium aminobutyricum]|uniref:Sporulation initiation inhibitor protein Soj n=1 Tax=Clostridium aminobutyricum TaxID=33953 RepID=A0A939DAI3_CLOAM|nr:ParA family protein [Clostridium aminobutyricum]MBN7773718.1 ParA family protein [Clostridium aminobutyricum]
MAKVIAVTNQKGGVAKTTTCNALISGLSKMGYKVLGIDLDPQGSLGFSLGINIEEGVSLYEVFKGKATVQESVRQIDCGHFIPSNILLSTAELEFSHAGREFLLSEAIKDIKDVYDYVVIDTPPALNILTVNAYVCADDLIIPMIPEILSLLGISQIKETIENVQKYYNPKLNLTCILLTKYNKRAALTQEVADMTQKIADQLGTKLAKTTIRNSVAVAEAPAHGLGLLEYSPKATACVDYYNFVKELINGGL